MNDVLRTPEARFQNLPDFPFAPNYRDDLAGFARLRMHYVDAGPPDADQVFLCLHGEPTWSYLYRKMIPVFTAAGHRVVAPDMFGFGRSDKPVDETVYTFDFHRNALMAFIEKLALQHITLVCQDWGGILGLTLPMAVGVKDPVLGLPVMQALRNDIAGCPQPYEHPDAGHFVQEWGGDIARKALSVFGT